MTGRGRCLHAGPDDVIGELDWRHFTIPADLDTVREVNQWESGLVRYWSWMGEDVHADMVAGIRERAAERRKQLREGTACR